jgi:hypothetical protein
MSVWKPVEVAAVASVTVPAVLLGLSGLHVAWALGSAWPAGDRRALAERVFTQAEIGALDGGMPPAAATWAVAGALGAMAAAVTATGAGVRSRRLRGATWAIAAVFGARAVAYLPSDLADGGPGDAYQRLDLTVYAPLCAAISAGTAAVARGAA